MSARIESSVNRLLARLFQEPALLERLRQDSLAVFREAGLSPEECTALRDGSFGALERIGVHPTLRMHYQLAVRPEIGAHVSIREFLPELLRERRHG
jgi:hypothetical protein